MQIVMAARGWIGTPYHHQASVKGVGCDCLGLLRGVWRDVRGEEPEQPPAYSRDWAEALGRETLAEAAARWMKPVALDAFAPGDVLLFALRPDAPAKHCAIVSERGEPVAASRMVHAIQSHPAAEVTIGPSWLRHLRYAFAFPEA